MYPRPVAKHSASWIAAIAVAGALGPACATHQVRGDAGAPHRDDTGVSVDATVPAPRDAPRPDAGPRAFLSCAPDFTGPVLVVLDDTDPEYLPVRHGDRLTVWALDSDGDTPLCDRRDLAMSEAIGTTHALARAPNGDLLAAAAGGDALFVAGPASEPVRTFAAVGATAVAATPDVAVVSMATDLSMAGAATLSYGGLTLEETTAFGGFDVVADPARGVVWSVGSELRIAPLDDIAAGRVVERFGWAGVSIDLAADGSVWIADRTYAMGGRAVHVATSGVRLATHELSGSPFCVRVHPRTGDVWIATSTAIVRIDRAGVVHELAARTGPVIGWFVLAPDYGTDGVWAAGDSDTDVVLVSSTGAITRRIPALDGAARQRHLLVLAP